MTPRSRRRNGNSGEGPRQLARQDLVLPPYGGGDGHRVHFAAKGWCVMVAAGLKYSYLCLGLLVAALVALVGSGARADLFVSSVDYNTVVQYDENTGAFLNVFASGGGLTGP